MTRPTNKATLDLVKQYEGYRGKAYKCPADVWTIGYGHTRRVYEGMTCSRAEADAWLKEDLATAGSRLRDRIGSVVDELTDNQYGALCSFVFNLGADPKWKIWRALKARDFDAVPSELVRFVYAGGKKLAGLVARRNAEVELWSLDEPGSEHSDLPSSSTRVLETPPAPAAKATLTSAPLVGGAVSAAATVTVAAGEVTKAIAPYADKSEHVAKVIAIIATIAAAAAVLVLVGNWLIHKRMKN